MTEQGTSILEVNHKDGYAVLNRPVYTYNDGFMPLVPDYKARLPLETNENPLQISAAEPKTLAERR